MDTIIRPKVLPRGCTEAVFCKWLGQAAPGEKLEYFRGFLALDVSSERGTLPEVDRRELALLARRAGWAAERGLVHLLQRRHGPDDTSYFAVARLRPGGISNPGRSSPS